MAARVETVAITDEKPTIVLVHGCFQTRALYEDLVNRLIALGYPTVHPQPNCTDTASPTFLSITLVDDVLAVRMELMRQMEYKGKTVMVVVHSYGVLVGSETIPEDLSYSKRQGQGLPRGIIHLFYFCDFILAEGQSVLDTFGEGPNNDVKPHGRFYLMNAEKILFNDLSASEAAMWAARLLPQSCKVQSTTLTRATWRHIKSTYMICENDQVMSPEYQEGFAASVKAKVIRCSAGPSPMWSQPLAQKIVEASKNAVK